MQDKYKHNFTLLVLELLRRDERINEDTVMAETNKLEARYKVWECRCDCGKITFVNTKKLKRGTITNCGCIPKNNAKKTPYF